MISVLNKVISRSTDIDLFIYAVGYEKRSRHAFCEYGRASKHKLGFMFNDGRKFSFDDNKLFAEKNDVTIFEQGESFVDVLRQEATSSGWHQKNIAIDVSSFNRGEMAKIFVELLDNDLFSGSSIFPLYSIAEFQPPVDQDVDFLDFGPIEGFGGWTAFPERPTSLVLGLGYDRDHAIGAYEHMDPNVTYCFSPIGLDSRFKAELNEANSILFEIIGNGAVIEYYALEPYQTFWEMRSLILPLLSNGRVVLVPMGPKIFTSLCFVFQRMFGEEVSIWRASGHTLETARDVGAAGPIASYCISRQT